MKILVVNCYQTESKNSQKHYKYFYQFIQELFQLNEVSDNYYIEREVNELSDYVVDWEHEQLHYLAEMNCERFDELDFIFIGGDLSILPWEPKSTQVISLIHMAKYTRKPLIGIGFGAFAVVYALATKGARYHILNGPLGDTIDSLPYFPHYSISTGAFPSGWLDHETGDIYSYDRARKGWMPVCNTGIHFVATTGRPASKQVHSRGFDRPIDDSAPLSGIHEADEDTLKITNLFLSSPLVGNSAIPLSKTFPVRLYHSWYLNREGALPMGENLFVVAEGKYGPSLLIKDRMFLVSARVENYNNVKHIKGILQNFISEVLNLLLSKESGKIDLSLYTFLFQKKARVHQLYFAEGQSPSQGTKLPSLVLDNSKLPSEAMTPSALGDGKPLNSPKQITPKSSPKTVLGSAKTRLQTTLLKEKQVADHAYDTAHDRLNKSVPLSQQIIPTRLKNGPVKVDPPVLSIFYKPIRPTPQDVDFYALTGGRKSSSIGRRPRQIVQNPVSGRKKRLELAFRSLGIEYNPEIIQKGLDPTAVDQNMPDYARDLLAGVVMKENNITERRHHFQLGGVNVSRGPSKPLTPAAAAAAAPPPSPKAVNNNDQPDISSFDKFSSLLISDNTIFEREGNEDRSESVVVNKDDVGLSAEPPPLPLNIDDQTESPRISSSKPPTASVTFKDPAFSSDEEEEDERDNFSMLTQDKIEQRREEDASKREGKVPTIADWIKIYERKDIIPTLISESERITRSTDRSSPVTSGAYSARAPSTRDQQTTDLINKATLAKPPKSMKGSTMTPRTLRTTDAVKNVHSILQIANKEYFLPVNHPKAISKQPKEYSIDHSLILGYDETVSSSPWKRFEEARYSNNQSSASYSSSETRENILEQGKVIILPNKTAPIQSNYLSIQQTIKRQEEQLQSEKYGGLYSEPFLSPRERELKEYNKAKETFLAGQFKTTFHHDTLELRKEGLVRPQGEYPRFPGPGYENLTAADWNFVRRENKEEFIFGAWKK